MSLRVYRESSIAPPAAKPRPTPRIEQGFFPWIALVLFIMFVGCFLEMMGHDLAGILCLTVPPTLLISAFIKEKLCQQSH